MPEASLEPPSRRPSSPLRSPSPLPSWLASSPATSPPPSPSAQLLPSSSPPPSTQTPRPKQRLLTAPSTSCSYDTHEDAFAAIQAYAKDEGYTVSYYKPSNYKDGKLRRYELVCVCGGRPY
ncbi:hypothetical protein EDB80DRAFT_731978 [Ilyonectria destructans]|nr:hypothetical protein EDB80DRAFT_731978 [Ilyonectria destructans]